MPNDDLVSLNYDSGGRLIEKWLPNGEDSQYLYNADNTLQSLSNKRGTTVISSHVYTYDPLGNRQTQAETIAGGLLNYTYGYDPLNRLIEVQNGTATQQENYTYDPIGNRLIKQVNATTPVVTAYVYDNANQLKEIRQGSAAGTLLASLTYDANGNMKTRSDTGLTLTYDALNRMTQATLGAQTSTYLYDALGRRLQKTVAGVATNYLYTGQNLLAEYGPTWGLPTSQYVHGPGIDDVIIRATSTAAQYFHQDGLNSVVATTNNLGVTDATQRFDAWGNKLASTGTSPHFGYTGREPDETGLMFYRARYYDPTLGRFIRRDPIGFTGGLNLYLYASDNPINLFDPFGFSSQDVANVWGWIASKYPVLTQNVTVSSSSFPGWWGGDGMAPGFGTIYIDPSYYNDSLTGYQQAALVNVLIHEALHQYIDDQLGSIIDYLAQNALANDAYHEWIKHTTDLINEEYQGYGINGKDDLVPLDNFPFSEFYIPVVNDVKSSSGGFTVRATQ